MRVFGKVVGLVFLVDVDVENTLLINGLFISVKIVTVPVEIIFLDEAVCPVEVEFELRLTLLILVLHLG